MFEVGFTEIVLILGLALLVLGPEKLPGLAAKVGRWTGRARAMARQLRTQLEQEVTLDELARSRPQTSNQTTNQTSTQTPSDTAPTPTAPDFTEPAPAAHPEAPPSQGLDLDATVSGIEPPPSESPPAAATPKSAP